MDGRDEAARCINLSLKLLVNRDLVGTKTFAIRAKEADPTMGYAEEILAVVDTLMAAQQQQINGRYDWYGILNVERLCRDTEVIASEYRRLALLLDPQRNGLPFADEAFGLVNEAWSVLSNPLRKSLYDNELSWLDGGSGSNVRVHQVQQHQFLPMQSQNQVQPQVVAPQRAQQYQHVPQQLQQQAPFQPQFQARPQPQVQFQQFMQQTRVQSPPASQPQVPAQSFPQPRVQSQPVTQPQAQRKPPQRVQSQQVTQHPPQPQVQSQSVTQPHDQPWGHARSQQQQQPQVYQQQSHSHQRQQESIPVQVDQHPPVWKSPIRNIEEEEELEELETDPAEVPTFWTACPYCYHLFEYLKEYEDCTLRCQNKNCRRAFHGSAIAPPPESNSDKKTSFCSWGFFPIGASRSYLNSGKKESGKHNWHPFSPMFTCPMEPSQGVAPVDPNSWNKARPHSKPKAVIVDDDDYVLMELSDSTDDSDTDWGSNSTRNKTSGRPPKVRKSPVRKSARRGEMEKSKSGTSEAGDASAANMASNKSVLNGNGSLPKKASGKNTKDLGKLDLNVEFNNEVEETMPTKTSTNGVETSTGAGTSAGAGTASGAEENIEAEGIGFFEGLDEFLNSLPILSAVGDDKGKAA